MIIYHQTSTRFLMLLLGLFLLASCKGRQVRTLSPEELSAAQTKAYFQAQTQQVRQLKTQGQWPVDTQAVGDQPPTSISPAQSESTQASINLTPTDDSQNQPAQPIYPITGQATSAFNLSPSATLRPTATRTQVFAAFTPTATRTKTAPPATATKTATQLQQSGWEGDWIISFEIKEGNFVSADMSVSLEGTILTGQANLGGVTYLFKGYTFNNDQYATGSWQTPLAKGSFWWWNLVSNQFSGSWDNHFGFCGKRSGANFPEPCKKLPPR